MAQIRTCRSSRRIFNSNSLSVWQDCLQAAEHILDSAIVGGELADTSRGHKAAQVCQRGGLRAVSCGQSLFVGQFFLLGERHPALYGCHHIFRIQFD